MSDGRFPIPVSDSAITSPSERRDAKPLMDELNRLGDIERFNLRYDCVHIVRVNERRTCRRVLRG